MNTIKGWRRLEPDEVVQDQDMLGTTAGDLLQPANGSIGTKAGTLCWYRRKETNMSTNTVDAKDFELCQELIEWLEEYGPATLEPQERTRLAIALINSGQIRGGGVWRCP